MARGQDLRREYSGTTKGCCTDTSGWDGGGRGSPLLSWPMYVSMLYALGVELPWCCCWSGGRFKYAARYSFLFFVGKQGEIARD